MRNTLQAFTALATLLAASPALAEEFEVLAPISSVKIHRDFGAIVNREVSVQLPAGNHSVVIGGLTDALDEDYGVRAKVVDGGGYVTQVNMDEVFMPARGRETQEQLITQIDALEQEQAADLANIEAINMQLRFIEDISKTTVGNGGSYTDATAALASLQQSFEFVKTASRDLLSERAANEKRRKTRQQQIDALKRELNQTGGKTEKAIEGSVGVSMPTGGTLKLQISYLVEDANWDVETRAELDTGTNQTSIQLFAQISQETGEDWDSIPLVLSTTSPTTDIGHVSPDPVYLNLQDPRQLLSKVRSGRVNSADAAPYGVEEVVVTGSQLIDYQAGEFDAEFTVASPSSIPADGSSQSMLVGTYQTSTATIVRTSPNWDQTAFLYADGEFTGLPSIVGPEASLTRGGTFIGSGTWPTLRAGQELQLPFGVDEQIKVEVITIPSEDGDTGIFNKRHVEETKQRFMVTNNHSTPMVIEVFDAMPNSMNEDLKVEPLRGATRASETDIDGQPGVIMWQREVAPGETWEINHWYRVSYPDDKNLVRQ